MAFDPAALDRAIAAGIIPALDEDGGFWVESPVDEGADPGQADPEVYFYHTTTGASQYERPEGVWVVKESDLPAELTLPQAQEEAAGDATAEAPSGVPVLCESGLVQFGDTLIDPALLDDWSAQTDDDGDTYYFNAALNCSMWEDPRALVAQAKGAAGPAIGISEMREAAARVPALEEENKALRKQVEALEHELASARLALTEARDGEERAIAALKAKRSRSPTLEPEPASGPGPLPLNGSTVGEVQRSPAGSGAPVVDATAEGEATAASHSKPLGFGAPTGAGTAGRAAPTAPGAGIQFRTRKGGSAMRRQSTAATMAAAALSGASGRKDKLALSRTLMALSDSEDEDSDEDSDSDEGGSSGADVAAAPGGGAAVSAEATKRLAGRLARGEALGQPRGAAPAGTVSFLKSVPLFHAFSESQFGFLMRRLQVLAFERGETIIRQGNTGDRFFIITEGKVAVHKRPDGAAPLPEVRRASSSGVASHRQRGVAGGVSSGGEPIARSESDRTGGGGIVPRTGRKRDSLQRGAMFALLDCEEDEEDQADPYDLHESTGFRGGDASPEHRPNFNSDGYAAGTATVSRATSLRGGFVRRSRLGSESSLSLDGADGGGGGGSAASVAGSEDSFSLDGAGEGDDEATELRRRTLGPVVAELSKGFFFGERALLTHEKRAASCVAASRKVECLCLDREAFKECVSGMEDMIGSYGRRFYGTSSEEYDGLVAHVAAQARALAEARGEAYQALVAAGLIDHAAVTGEFPTPMPSAFAVSTPGAAPSSASACGAGCDTPALAIVDEEAVEDADDNDDGTASPMLSAPQSATASPGLKAVPNTETTVEPKAGSAEGASTAAPSATTPPAPLATLRRPTPPVAVAVARDRVAASALVDDEVCAGGPDGTPAPLDLIATRREAAAAPGTPTPSPARPQAAKALPSCALLQSLALHSPEAGILTLLAKATRSLRRATQCEAAIALLVDGAEPGLGVRVLPSGAAQPPFLVTKDVGGLAPLGTPSPAAASRRSARAGSGSSIMSAAEAASERLFGGARPTTDVRHPGPLSGVDATCLRLARFQASPALLGPFAECVLTASPVFVDDAQTDPAYHPGSRFSLALEALVASALARDVAPGWAKASVAPGLREWEDSLAASPLAAAPADADATAAASALTVDTAGPATTGESRSVPRLRDLAVSPVLSADGSVVVGVVALLNSSPARHASPSRLGPSGSAGSVGQDASASSSLKPVMSPLAIASPMVPVAPPTAPTTSGSATPGSAVAPGIGMQRISVRTERVLTGTCDALTSALEHRGLEASVMLGAAQCIPQHTVRDQLAIEVLATRHLPPPKGTTFSKSGAVKRVPSSATATVSMTLYHADVPLGAQAATRPAAVVVSPALRSAGLDGSAAAASKAEPAPPLQSNPATTAPRGVSSRVIHSSSSGDVNPMASDKLHLGTAWHQWLESGLAVSDAPVGARVIFNVTLKDGTACGWAGTTLFDHRGCLRTGTLTLRLWPGAGGEDQALNATCLANRYAEAGSAPEIIVKFPPFAAPVMALPDPPLPPRGDDVALGRQSSAGSRSSAEAVAAPTSGMPDDSGATANGEVAPLAALHSAWADSASNLAALRDRATSGEFRAAVATIRAVAATDPLRTPSPAEKALLWRCRHFLVETADVLPKFLQAVPWHLGAAAAEAASLIRMWRTPSPVQALQLLDNKFPDPTVRALAVSCLERMGDAELGSFLLQLSQVLKFEPHLDSALARFLLRRALRRPRLIGHQLFWLLRAEMHVPEVAERFGAILEAYLRAAGDHRTELGHQMFVMTKLEATALAVKAVTGGKGERVKFVRGDLPKIVFPERFQLPLSPGMVASGLRVDKCSVMSSKKLPLWLSFERPPQAAAGGLSPLSGAGLSASAASADGAAAAAAAGSSPAGPAAGAAASSTPLLRVLFKAGDDLRQDQLTLQVLRVMDGIWRRDGLDLSMRAYGCVSTGDEIGLLEVVPNSETIASIVAASVRSSAKGFGRKLRAAISAYREDTLLAWLEAQPGNADRMDEVLDRFARSCAAYCVATYVMGIGDRHNDNVMMTRDGCFFHIDFGHFLGNFKKKLGYKRERAPFIFTPSMATVLGGQGSPMYERFEDLCCRAFNSLRRNAELLITLFALMKSCGLPELRRDSDIFWLRDHLCLGMTEEAAAKHFRGQIDEARRTRTTQFNDACHLLKHA